MIIFEKEISEYYNQPYDAMYNDLLAIKKDQYAPDEQIVITAYYPTDKAIWTHFDNIIKLLDIPTFFIHIKRNEKLETLENSKFHRSDSFCITPFINAEVNVNGDIRPCCELQHTELSVPQIQNSTLDSAYQSELFNQLRQDFINGVYPDACNFCWKRENVGITSKRQRDKWIYAKEYYTTDIFQESKIKSLDLKIGFQCNLKCRICYNGNSSLWYTEDKKYQNVPNVREIDYMIDAGKDFWLDQIKYFEDIEHISMKGGEPLLDHTHLKMLKKLLQLGKNNVKIHYNTNGTIFPERHLEVLDEFDDVTFSLSIDNIGDKFNYERNGVAWEKVKSNLENFAKLNRSKYRIDLFTTVSVMNVLDLTETMNYAASLNFNHELNPIIKPEYFSIQNIPLDKRQHVIDYLDSSPHERVREISGKLKQDTYTNLNEEFWQKINEIDLRRNQNFAQTYPEMSAIMSL